MVLKNVVVRIFIVSSLHINEFIHNMKNAAKLFTSVFFLFFFEGHSMVISYEPVILHNFPKGWKAWRRCQQRKKLSSSLYFIEHRTSLLTWKSSHVAFFVAGRDGKSALLTLPIRTGGQACATEKLGSSPRPTFNGCVPVIRSGVCPTLYSSMTNAGIRWNCSVAKWVSIVFF